MEETEKRQAGSELERITPEMIEAGESALFSAVSPEDIHTFAPSVLVAAIYEAMARSAPSHPASMNGFV